MNPGLSFGVPASASEAFDQSDAPEFRKPCRLKAELRTRRFMELDSGGKRLTGLAASRG